MSKPKTLGFLIALHLCLMLLLMSTQQPVKACEPIMDTWFEATLSLGTVRVPEPVQIQTTEGGTYVHIHNPEMEPLYVLSQDAVQSLFADGMPHTDGTPEQNTWPEQVSSLASYMLPSDELPSGVYIPYYELLWLNPQLEDRRNWSLSPPPNDVEIPAEDRAVIFLLFDGQLYEVPVEITFHLNEQFYADDCTAWAHSLEAAAARDKATQAMTIVVVALCVVLVFSGVIILIKKQMDQRR
jgi:hypothetical protein